MVFSLPSQDSAAAAAVEHCCRRTSFPWPKAGLRDRYGRIGASLEAAPTVYVDAATADLLGTVAFDDLCITSGITVSTNAAPGDAFTLDDVAGVAVSFAKADGAKCQRCWKILPDVGSHAHAGVCGRCNDALS